ncbi:hypothetical protein Tcan_01463, partial [Toxocara canis]
MSGYRVIRFCLNNRIRRNTDSKSDFICRISSLFSFNSFFAFSSRFDDSTQQFESISLVFSKRINLIFENQCAKDGMAYDFFWTRMIAATLSESICETSDSTRCSSPFPSSVDDDDPTFSSGKDPINPAKTILPTLNRTYYADATDFTCLRKFPS